MRLLPDTHTAIWFAYADSRLSISARIALSDPDNVVLLSSAVCWEVAIKRGMGKWKVAADYDAVLLAAGAVELPITRAHAQGVESLPCHHRDPFDRLLISQARAERATLVTADPAIALYDVPVLW